MNGYHIQSFGYDEAKHTADYLKLCTSLRPQIGIICGSGLGGLVDMLDQPEYIDYKNIPGFPNSTAPGHVGRLVFGRLRGKEVVCMQGRIHMYEGNTYMKMVFPVRVMKLLDVEILIVTNAAGGVNVEYQQGDLMIIKDHINLPGMAGNNPLIGYNDERFGSRFLSLCAVYDVKLRDLAKQVARQLGLDHVREGVYVLQPGPSYETVTECRLMKVLGADVAGMSTVPEVIVARHCGMRVFGLSVVTNMCVGEYDTDKTVEEHKVLEAGRMRSNDVQMLISKMVEHIEL